MLWNKLSAVQDCLEILNSCTNDVLDIISEFSHASTKPEFWNLINRIEQERYANQLKKHMYCTASAAGSFFWHSECFAKEYPADGLTQKRKECFENTGLNNFIRGLRNYVIHEKIVKANWRISWDANKKRDVKFVLDSEELLKSGAWEPKKNKKSEEWKLKAKQFIEYNKDGINVYEIFHSYLKCANNYYSWHKAKVIAKYSTVLKRYFVYKRHLNKVEANTSWNMMISHLNKDLDVFQYLDKYLTPQQLEDVLSYENGSKQQVDRLIEVIDVYKACDDELRLKIYSKLVRNA